MRNKEEFGGIGKMNFNILFFVIALVVGSISFLIGFKLGPKRDGFHSNSFVKNYALVPLATINLFNILYAIGLGPSKNDDYSFSEVIQYQEDTLPLIMNMISKVKSND